MEKTPTPSSVGARTRQMVRPVKERSATVIPAAATQDRLSPTWEWARWPSWDGRLVVRGVEEVGALRLLLVGEGVIAAVALEAYRVPGFRQRRDEVVALVDPRAARHSAV